MKRHILPIIIAAVLIASAALAPSSQAAEPKISSTAALQMQSLTGIKTAKTATQNKIGSRLFLGLMHQRHDARLALLTDFRFVKPDDDGRVAVDILLADVAAMKPVLNTLESLGGAVRAKSYSYLTINARVHLEDLETLAAISGVRKVREAVPGVPQSMPQRPGASHQASREKIQQALPDMIDAINVSEGDKTHGADEARAFFGANGSGVKVCVMSNGVDSLASLQASGDLPPTVDVLPGQAGSGDEGSAMLEIVHDLAPGAALGFATSNPNETTFVANILALGGAGCNIIVDDIIYYDESPFEDGPLAQAVNTVTSVGVLYFSSAGNQGCKDDGTSGTWEGDFNPSAAADPAPLAGANLHNFGDGGNSILITATGNPPVLIWAEHYDLTTGTASTDFDLYDMDGGLTTIFDASTDVQDGTGGDDFPVEISGQAFSGERLLIDKFAAGTTSSSPMFNLLLFGGRLDSARVTFGTSRGHSAAANAFSVAATPAAASFDGISPAGPYPNLFTAANASESFTSDGPRRLLLDGTTGTELTPGNRTSTGGVVRQKPDITAADGVSTAAPGYLPFYGTSAAAPHAAAIAALLKSAVPAITPAQVRTALISTAIDIEAPGVDRDTGAGIVMAHAALQAAGATPSAFLAGLTPVPTQIAGDGDAFIEPNEDWSLTIPLQNNGGVAATAISATLATTTPGITI